MHKFYEEVVGLEALRRDESFVFFKVAEGYGGHTQNLALFDATNTDSLEPKSQQLSSEQTTLHHIALNIALEDYESEKGRLEGLGLKVTATVHAGGDGQRCLRAAGRAVSGPVQGDGHQAVALTGRGRVSLGKAMAVGVG